MITKSFNSSVGTEKRRKAIWAQQWSTNAAAGIGGDWGTHNLDQSI